MKTEKSVVIFSKRLKACGSCLDTNNHKAFSRFCLEFHETCGPKTGRIYFRDEVSLSQCFDEIFRDNDLVERFKTQT